MNPNQDDQNQPASPDANLGGPAAEQPTAAEKCETCGKDSNNGNCSGCYQPNASCSCPPEAPAEGSAEGGDQPAAPAM